MNLNSLFNKPSIQGVARVVKRERIFELSLPTVVRGIDAWNKEFQEKTHLLNISAQEASLWLKNKVTLGAKLRLSLSIPKTIILEKPLQLFLSGTVVSISSDSNKNNKQRVFIRIDKNYKIQPLN